MSRCGCMATGGGVKRMVFLRSCLSVDLWFLKSNSPMPWTTQIQETAYPTTMADIKRGRRRARGTL